MEPVPQSAEAIAIQIVLPLVPPNATEVVLLIVKQDVLHIVELNVILYAMEAVQEAVLLVVKLDVVYLVSPLAPHLVQVTVKTDALLVVLLAVLSLVLQLAQEDY